MVIHMNDFRKAKAVKPAGSSPCHDERLCVKPAFNVIALSCFRAQQALSPKLPEDFAAVEPAFINRVYALASQI